MAFSHVVVGSFEWEAACEGFEHADTHGVDVGAGFGVDALDLLGGHVEDRTDLRASDGEAEFSTHTCDAKVDEFDAPVSRDEDVGGLKVSVDNAVFVGVCESGEGLAEDGHNAPHGEPTTATKHRVEILSIDELHDQEELAIFFDEGVQGHQVGMIKRGERTCFLEEAFT